MEKDRDPIKDVLLDDFYTVDIPSDFTEKVMANVQVLAKTKRVSKPLISKRAWWTVVSVGFLIFLLGFWMDLQKMALEIPFSITLPKMDFTDFKISIRIFAIISTILLIMTLADVFYRKVKRNT